ncbi:hypothetical protein AGDE_11148 [Angomonas deanei]|nr:hypothetical protein AGDE_11148 [Angomonas deanei]|eukprot:EPY26676.1 hypothetical protein AGDE_11148 [Angomonas deanei]
MSLRAESLKVYRHVHRAAYKTAVGCSLYNPQGFLDYVGVRFAARADGNRRRLNELLSSLEVQEKQLATRGGNASKKAHAKRQSAQERKKMISQYEKYVSTKIDEMYRLAEMLPEAMGNEALMSILQVLGANVGNTSYQAALEEGFINYFHFEQKRTERNEVEEEATSEYQNRIMQQAILPYAERLLLLHRTAVGEHNEKSNLVYLSPWQVTDAIVGTRSGVTAHHMQLGHDHLVLEIDETHNKQILYVCCTRYDEGGSYNWEEEVERVDISESEELRKTLLHAEYLSIAHRLLEALTSETPLHTSRRTTIMGHGVGGAVGLIMGLLLSQRGFPITNTISLGAPKALQGTLERYVAMINPIRIVLAGDPLIDLPVSGAEGDLFVHLGEILLLSPEGTAEDGSTTEEKEHKPEEDGMTADALSNLMNDDEESESFSSPPPQQQQQVEEEDEEDLAALFAEVKDRYNQHFLIEHYVEHLSNPSVPLEYAEGEEVWDEGEYSAMRREESQKPFVSGDERREGDLRGPL